MESAEGPVFPTIPISFPGLPLPSPHVTELLTPGLDRHQGPSRAHEVGAAACTCSDTHTVFKAITTTSQLTLRPVTVPGAAQRR